MRIFFPNEEIFNAENFANCPLILIEQALAAINQHQIESANLHAIPVANIGTWFCYSKGVKSPKPDWFNPFAGILYAQKAKAIINPKAAQIFLKLVRESKTPTWVMSRADIPLIEAAANG